jgi:type II secretory pathway component PulF
MKRKRGWKILTVLVAVAVTVFVVFFGILALGAPVPAALLALLLPMTIAGFIAFSYFHYRFVRQEELLLVLINAVESGTPLNAALWAYVDDRPRSRWREILVSLLITPFYYWSWHRWNTFDSKVEQLAGLIDVGASLHEGLVETPGVASKEVMLAVALGESTGKLGPCLKSVPRWRLATVWLEVFPRLVYPLVLLLGIMITAALVLIFIVPKFERIFASFKMRLPAATENFIAFGREHGKPVALIAVLVLLGVSAALLISSRLCWHVPILGRLYRMQSRGHVLRTLALLLETGHTVPEALEVLEGSEYFSGTVRRRLRLVRFRVALGEPFLEQLCQQGLLPQHMLPLLRAAERANNLPWAFKELGETLGTRTARLTHRLSMTVFPTAVMAVGLAVGFFAFAMFSPLVRLISELPL